MYEEIKGIKEALSKRVGTKQSELLQLLGEIMKETMTITSFEQLMKKTTNILIRRLGISNCYIWVKIQNERLKRYKFYSISDELEEPLKVTKCSIIPPEVADIEETYLFKQEEITTVLGETKDLPGSRLAIPIRDFNENVLRGIVIIEHKDKDYFNESIIAFLETLTIYIKCRAINLELLKSVGEKSQKDPLTGTYNRRYLREALEKIENKYGCITVAVIDTDNFKHINDILGHIEGDAVLKAIAQLAKGTVKEYGGEVVRYGGDEFVIIIPKPLTETLHILEELRSVVPYLKIVYDLETDLSITLGVCSYPEMIKDYEELIKVADSALLRGKAKGKNQVVLASDEDMGIN